MKLCDVREEDTRMERTIEFTGKTVDQAVRQALRELAVSEDMVLIDVLDEGETGGLLGFGRRPARVRVTILDDEDELDLEDDDEEDGDYERVDLDDEDLDLEPSDEDGWRVPADQRGLLAAENAALDYVQDVLSGIGIHGRIESYLEGDNTLHIDIISSDGGVAIGRHGETLDAIQYLTNIVTNRWIDEYLRVVIDVGDYRRRREQRIQQTARKIASRVLDRGRASKMKPMSPAERRIVHITLRETEGITTYSEGSEPRRYVVIAPTAGLEIID
jgi:spoIIIJ-associated protein